MYSLFYVSLLNYDGQADIADKGWLELNKNGNGTMQDVFKTKYSFYTLTLYFSQMFLALILLYYTTNNLV
jgi:hypothetical protein